MNRGRGKKSAPSPGPPPRVAALTAPGVSEVPAPSSAPGPVARPAPAQVPEASKGQRAPDLPRASKTLLEINAEIVEKEKSDPLAYAKARQLAEEARLLEEATRSQKTSLTTHAEKAKGKVYSSSMPAVGGWFPPTKFRNMTEKEGDALRQRYQIDLDGEGAPPPMDSFRDMRFPNVVLNALAEKGIRRPTPIQMQGLPCALSGRDMIGIAFTGSGKTITFALPLLMIALEEELKLPLQAGEGPIGMICAHLVSLPFRHGRS